MRCNRTALGMACSPVQAASSTGEAQQTPRQPLRPSLGYASLHPGWKPAILKSRASDNDDEESGTTMKKSKSGSKEGNGGDSPSQLIDARVKELGDWRG